MSTLTLNLARPVRPVRRKSGGLRRHSAFFAHLVAEDRHHLQACVLFEKAARESWTLITTNAVVSETYMLIRMRARNGHELAVAFLDDIRDGVCVIERSETDR